MTMASYGPPFGMAGASSDMLRTAPLTESVPMPVQRPSSCTFGGPDRRTLYLHRSCVDLDYQQLQIGALAGALSRCEQKRRVIRQTPSAAREV